MLIEEITTFLHFFKLPQQEINNLIFRNNFIQWDNITDTNIMERSGLRSKIIVSQYNFVQYMKTLKNDTIDYYPTFLKILDLLELKELDALLETIFLGKPQYNCSN